MVVVLGLCTHLIHHLFPAAVLSWHNHFIHVQPQLPIADCPAMANVITSIYKICKIYSIQS